MTRRSLGNGAPPRWLQSQAIIFANYPKDDTQYGPNRLLRGRQYRSPRRFAAAADDHNSQVFSCRTDCLASAPGRSTASRASFLMRLGHLLRLALAAAGRSAARAACSHSERSAGSDSRPVSKIFSPSSGAECNRVGAAARWPPSQPHSPTGEGRPRPPHNYPITKEKGRPKPRPTPLYNPNKWSAAATCLLLYVDRQSYVA
jgi:hypothetical protein